MSESFRLPSFLIFVAIVAAGPVGLTASTGRAADQCLDVRLACSGFEPNWQFVTGLDGEGDATITFTDPENPDGGLQPVILEGCVLSRAGGDGFQVLSGAPVDIEATVTPVECVEPNDAVQPYTIDIIYNQGSAGEGTAAAGSRISGTGCCLIAQ